MTCTDGGASSGGVSDVLIAREFRTAREVEFGRTTLRGAKWMHAGSETMFFVDILSE